MIALTMLTMVWSLVYICTLHALAVPQDCEEPLVLLQTHLQLKTAGFSSPSDSTQKTSANGDGTHDGVTARAQEKPLLFAGVFVARSYKQERDEVRESWWQHPFVKNGLVQARFFVGEAAPGENTSVALALAAEEATHGDIIHLPLVDSYDNLTLKTAAFFQWFAREQPAQFMAKIDHDGFPHLDLLVPELRRAAPSQYVYMGCPYLQSSLTAFCGQGWMICDMEDQTHEYHSEHHHVPGVYVLKTDWKNLPMGPSGPIVPEFMHGSAYILSAILVDEIAVKRWSTMKNVVATLEDFRVGLWIHIVNQSLPVDYVHVQGSAMALNDGWSTGDVLSENCAAGQLKTIWADQQLLFEQ